jgi:hypothetical protein
MATVTQVADYMRTNINWTKVFSVIATLGKTMNGQKDRFDKSDIIEMAIAAFSNNAVEYLNADGVDHLLTNLKNKHDKPTGAECKFNNELFYAFRSIERASKKKGILGRKELKLIDKPVTLKLVNSQGENKHKALPEGYAEFVLALDTNSAFVIETAKLIPYLKFSGDGIEAKKVPANLFTKIVGPGDIAEPKALEGFDYKKAKLEFQRNFLSKF